MCCCRFCYDAALLRIHHHNTDIESMRWQARSEQLLMSFYNASLPSITIPTYTEVQPHDASTTLLQDNCPWMLNKYIPADVGGDGNCLFRAVSLSLYSTETHYMQLRVLCLIEVLLHPGLYDSSSAEFYPPYAADNWLCLPSYESFVLALSTDGEYSDMLTVLSLSTVTQKAIQTLWPLCTVPGAQSPLTKFVMGQHVQSGRQPVYILWTTCSYKGPNTDGVGVSINHFVPLIELPDNATQYVLLDCDNQTQAPQSAYNDIPPRTEQTHEVQSDASVNVNVGFALDGQFLSVKQCITLLENCTDDTLAEIPDGIKNNKYFIIDQTANMARTERGEKRCFRDDCGAWQSVRSVRLHYDRATLRQLLYRNGVYCIRQQVDGCASAVPLENQPTKSDIITVQHYFSNLHRDNKYKCRVTFVEHKQSVALLEYLGTFPETIASHGNSKSRGEYIRTAPHVIGSIASACHNNKPKTVYVNKINAVNESDRPRNLKQVQNTAAKNTKLLNAIALLCY